MDFIDLQKSRCGCLIESLEMTIKKIKSEQMKNPLVMILFGSYPSFSQDSGTPHHAPKYLDYLLANYPDVFPVVLAIDPLYTPENIRQDNSLGFLKYNQEDLIKLVDNRDRFNQDPESNVSDRYILTKNKKIVYRFLGWTLDEPEIDHLFWYLNLKAIDGVPTLFWNFIGHHVGNEEIIKKGYLHYPEANCMGDVGSDLTYFPLLIKDKNGGYQVKENPKSLSKLLENYQSTMTKYLTLDVDDSSEKKKLETKIQFYESNLYYILNEILGRFKGYLSWTNQFQKEGFVVDRTENNYLEKAETVRQRLRGFGYEDKLVKEFEESKYKTLDDFVRGEIFSIGSNCLDFLSILDSNFNYSDSLASLIDGYANIFDDFIVPIQKMLKDKYSKLINY